MPDRIEHLQRLLRERIVIIDGAMGTMIQQHKLDEAAFRGARFANWRGKDLKGLNDLLNVTQPHIIEGIHRQYLEAGADIIETNTFNAQSISLADYGMESLAYELSKAGAECARRAADAVEKSQPSRICFVAGAIGPTTKTSSISTDVNNPGARGTDYDELVTAYSEQINGLLDGGADVLLVETIFDTLNARAAFFAIQNVFDQRGISPLPYGAKVEAGKKVVPILASVTFIQAGSNRGVTGQTVEAFWNSVANVPLLSVGMNCALGPKELRPLIEELSGIAPVYVSAYPNAGLPNPLLPTGFPETPESLAPQLREWAQNGWLNIVGGCCGTTPPHIKAIAEAVKGLPPRKVPTVEPYLRLSGLEFHCQRAAPERRHELRARSKGIASAHRGTFWHRADLCQRVSERRAAESAVADRVSRNAGIARAAIARVGAERLAQYRWRLLRHDAAAHQGDCRSGERFATAQSSDSQTVFTFERIGCVDRPAANKFSQHRRAH